MINLVNTSKTILICSKNNSQKGLSLLLYLQRDSKKIVYFLSRFLKNI